MTLVHKWFAVLAALILVFAVACDSDSSGDENPGTDVVTGGGGEDDTTGGGGGENAHPYWSGADWDNFLPSADESAVYHVTTFDSEEMDLTAHLVEGVAWRGGTWTQIVVGELEAGKDGMAIYVDLSTPWLARAKGVEVYDTNTTDGPSMVEWFDDPIVIPLDTAAGVPTNFSTTINGNYGGWEASMGVNYSIEIIAYDKTVTLDSGELTGCVEMIATLTGELIGDGEVQAVIMAHPEQRIVSWVDSPGFLDAVLKELW